MTDDFYKAFEDRFRGPPDEIKERLKIYLPFLRALKATDPTHLRCLDIGCGRGEWLELLSDEGFEARGVDLNEAMVKHCQDNGLKVEYKDALLALKELQSNSLCIVSGFHIAEHLPFEVLRELFFEAQRVLVPSGLLIFETPNPENLMVGGNYFYLDPTHAKPIPMQLLSFVAEYYGFGRVKTLRLNSSASNHRGLLSVLTDVSPDYAIIGQKQPEASQLDTYAELFKVNVGVSISEATQAYDETAKQAYDETAKLIKQRLDLESVRLDQVEERLYKLVASLRVVESAVDSFATLRKLGARKSMGKITKKILKKVFAHLRSNSVLKRTARAILPKRLTYELQEKMKSANSSTLIKQAVLSAYANEFYNNLKTARKQR